MLQKEQWMQIHVLKAQGLSLREIARHLGVSRNTVTRYLASQDVPRYKQREPRPTKLDPCQAYIVERMQAAAPDTIAAPAPLRELRARGYEGKLRSIQAFMKAHKPAPAPDPIVRFETEPGRQMQCDFVVFRRGADPLYAFTATLGFSRWRWARFATNEKAETLIACHHALFETLGGVPREILYDNAKTIVLERDAYGKGEHRWHPGLLDLAKRYGFMPRLCQPYRARTKGKIERFHRYLRGNLYVPLSSWLEQSGMLLDVETANAEVGKWLRDVANQRVHLVTGATPASLFEERERDTLRKLPAFATPLPVISPAVRPTTPSSFSLQHPLSVYQQLLTEVRA
ncbi:IS21 family transposase [Paraburkholderia atlantica]|uniref:Integrase catalytic region n=1 Tax=Paraburkholderia atlantica TaxID=2654982 RepID=D5WN68_PARAM|nr:IS21 family transposase [Paraburkholderia atlantica]ADG20747.1 Integrase catalytic region [Paraburkholderia atlantica]